MLGLVRTMSRIERQARAEAEVAALAEREEQAALTAELQIVLREVATLGSTMILADRPETPTKARQINFEPQGALDTQSLLVAAKRGHVEHVAELVRAGADLEASSATGATELIFAARHGHAECVAELIAGRGLPGARRNPATLDIALVLAAAQGHAACVELVAQEVVAKGTEAKTPRVRHAAVSCDGALAAYGDTALGRAASEGHLTCVEVLLRSHVTAKRSDRDKALLMAARNGHAPCVETLLSHGADVATDRAGDTALSLAAGNGHAACVNFLVQAGASLEHKSHHNLTPLLKAAQNGHATCVEALAAAGADLEATELSQRATALLLAVGAVTDERRPHDYQPDTTTCETVESLLKVGANPHATARSGLTAVAHAAGRGRVDLVLPLLIARADRGSAMSAAVAGGHRDIVALLQRDCRGELELVRAQQRLALAVGATRAESGLDNDVLATAAERLAGLALSNWHWAVMPSQ